MADELIEAYIASLRLRRCSSDTIDKRGLFLRRLDRELPCGLPAASADELAAAVYREEYSDWTLSTYHGHIKGFFTWATDPRHPHLDFNPVALLPTPKTVESIPNPVSDAQHAVLMRALTGQLLLAAKLAAYAGMRCVEICRADREHITAQNVSIPKGKGNRAGVVPTHTVIWTAVNDMAAGPLLLTPTGDRWNAHQLSQNASRHLTAILGEDCGLHRLRHWYGTTIYRHTRDLRRTQEALRHRSPNSTVGYTLIADEERREAIATLPVI